MALNEWGDFIAGAFAPLALLWLVIGYFQHGEELRLNTEALRMQQMELQRQVEETAHLVEAANRQALAAQQDLQHRQEREAREAEPEFILGTESFSSGQAKATINLQNRGGEARDVSLHYDGPYQFKFRPRPYIETNGRANLSFTSRGKQPLDYPIRFRITSVLSPKCLNSRWGDAIVRLPWGGERRWRTITRDRFQICPRLRSKN